MLVRIHGEASWTWNFLCGKVFDDKFNLIDIKYPDFLLHFVSILVSCVFEGIFPFHLSC